jgi:hypothetical protein
MIRAIDLMTGKFTMHGSDQGEVYGNQLYAIFKVAPDVQLKSVVPATYVESMFYLKAKRVIDQF